jgi:hypothetical protein
MLIDVDTPLVDLDRPTPPIDNWGGAIEINKLPIRRPHPSDLRVVCRSLERILYPRIDRLIDTHDVNKYASHNEARKLTQNHVDGLVSYLLFQHTKLAVDLLSCACRRHVADMSPTADNIGKILPTGRCRDIDIFFFCRSRAKKCWETTFHSYAQKYHTIEYIHFNKQQNLLYNNQLEPPPPSYHRLFPPLSPWVEQRPIKSWRRRSPRPCAGREPSGLHSLSLVWSFGGAKREGSKNRGRGGCLGP